MKISYHLKWEDPQGETITIPVEFDKDENHTFEHATRALHTRAVNGELSRGDYAVVIRVEE